MPSKPTPIQNLEFHPVTSDRWRDLERLFGKSGACGGCWCMWWRVKRAEFSKRTGQKNKRMMKQIVDSGEIPGLLAYADGDPVGWCSIAPREAYPVLERSWTLKRIDNEPVWSVLCFYVAERFRSKGLMSSLLEAAVRYAKTHGAKVIEGYPIEPKGRRLSGFEGFTGVASTFKKHGFVEAIRRSPSRPIMRYSIPNA